jgi:3-methyl-2-oxobutanoate hydroxymethyltransferase
MKKTIDFLRTRKSRAKNHHADVYDYPSAVIQEKAGIVIIFVGDSVGTNKLGYKDATEVTMADMLHHLKASDEEWTKLVFWWTCRRDV